MSWFRTSSLVLTIAASGLCAEASPNQVTAEGWDGREDFGTTAIQSDDLSSRYGFYLVQKRYDGPTQLLDPNFGKWQWAGESIDSDFHLRLTFTRPSEDISPVDSPYILLSGHASGYFVQGSRASGGFHGDVVSAELHNWTPGSEIPRPLLDQFLDPTRLHISGSVGGGSREEYEVHLVVDPPSPGSPSPVPEPTTLATYAIVLGGLSLHHRPKFIV